MNIILSRPEFLVLLDALRATAVVGLDLGRITPHAHDEYRALLEQGHTLLERRGLLTRHDDGHLVLNTQLLMLGAVVAFPAFAAHTTVTYGNNPQELYLHYEADGLAVEQNFPEPALHRLKLMASALAIVDRLCELVPITVSCEHTTPHFLPLSVLGLVGSLVAEDKIVALEQVLDIYVADPKQRELLLETVQQPTVRGSIALMTCAGATITAARNPAFIVGRRAAWLVFQSLPGSPTMTLEQVDAEGYRERIQGWVRELAIQTTIVDNSLTSSPK